MTERELEQIARKRVKKKKDFYSHLSSYAVIIGFLFVLNLMTNPDVYWFQWPAFGWGIGLAFHAASVFGIFGSGNEEWEEEEIEREMKKIRRKKGVSKRDYLEDDLLLRDEHLELKKKQEDLELREIKKERSSWNDRDFV